MRTIRVAGAQLNLRAGDLSYNESRLLDAMRWAERREADVLLFPELAIPGYPPEDLVIRRRFVDANLAMLDRLASEAREAVVIVGFIDRLDTGDRAMRDSMPRVAANAVALLHQGRVQGVYHKVLLPNYGVFDEARYFAPGTHPGAVWNIGGVVVGVSICEDIWIPHGPPSEQAARGAQILLNVNGSPFRRSKDIRRLEHIRREAMESSVPVVYLNLIGGQDELVFDGGSMVVDQTGSVRYRSPSFEEDLFAVDVEVGEGRLNGQDAVVVHNRPERPRRARSAPAATTPLSPLEATYRALTLGLGDYVRKNGFSKVVVGLSGGIDSALTAVIATDALGPEAVRGVTMPSKFSSVGSVRDSKELARRLGIRCDTIEIAELYAAYGAALAPHFEGTDFGVAEENLQPRIRGTLLMAISNKHGEMVIATGNKSEMAVGYATLYGDMVGGFAVLKDVLKTRVYELARWRNTLGEVIPEATITKAPSAELRPGQFDTDSLPPYELLDPILAAYIEEDRSVADIAEEGYSRRLVERVAEMVDRNEYKRRQSPPGVKITTKAFGRDRRLPITNGWYGG